MGYFAMSMNLAVVAGPFIGLTLVQSFSFNVFFIVLSILMIISFLCTLVVQLNEEKRAEGATLALRLSDLFDLKENLILIICELFSIYFVHILSFLYYFDHEHSIDHYY